MCLAAAFDIPVVDRQVRRLHSLRDDLRRRRLPRFAEGFQNGIHRQPAGDLAVGLAADAVGQHGDRAA